jgi:hypothetical protein
VVELELLFERNGREGPYNGKASNEREKKIDTVRDYSADFGEGSLRQLCTLYNQGEFIYESRFLMLKRN